MPLPDTRYKLTRNWGDPYGRLFDPTPGIPQAARSECEVQWDIYATLAAQKQRKPGDPTVSESWKNLLLRELHAARENAKRISVTVTKEPEHPFRD